MRTYTPFKKAAAINVPAAKPMPTTDYPMPNKDELLLILGAARRHNSLSEQTLGDYIAETTGAIALLDHNKEVLAYYHTIPHMDGTASRTLFSAHLDTVDNNNEPHQLVETANILHTGGTSVLGADDGAGVWLMLQMIHNGVPGGYMFPRGEECGGIGAKGLAIHHADLLIAYDKAVAFDRANKHSVITHQGFGRCCSDAFGEALATQLTDAALDAYMFTTDDTGVYTDTAEWTDIIPECTNLSVGYFRQHTHNEELDLPFLDAMVEICCAVEWDALPCERDPLVQEASKWDNWNLYKDDAADYSYNPPTFEEAELMDYEALCDACQDYPDDMAAMLFDLFNARNPR